MAFNNDQPLKQWPIAVVLMVGSFISILNLTILTTAIPYIMNTIKITPNKAQWVNTAFILVIGIIIPITAYLMKTYTVRKLFFSAMGAFTTGTFLCSVAPIFEILLVGRVIQAIGAGIMFPLVQTVVVLIFPVNKRGTIMGISGLVAAFAPAIGPTLSGWLIDIYSWRAVFYVVLPIALVDIIIAYFVLRNVTELSPSKVDISSVVLSVLGFGGVLFGLSIAGSNGFDSGLIWSAILIGAFSLVGFIFRQFQLKKPMLEFRVFSNKIYSVAIVIAIISFSSMISGETILPIYMHNVLGFSAFEAGIVLLPGAIVFGGVTLISGMIYDRIGVRWLAIIGLTVLVCSTFMFTRLTESTSFSYLVSYQTLRMLGISMVNTPIKTAAINQLPHSLIPDGTTMMGAIRQISAGIVTALLITIMTLGKGLQSAEALVQGVNLSFLISTCIGIVGVSLSLFVNEKL